MPEILGFFAYSTSNAALISTILSRGSLSQITVEMKSVAATPFSTFREKVYLS
jgi:hypothetical protein